MKFITAPIQFRWIDASRSSRSPTGTSSHSWVSYLKTANSFGLTATASEMIE
jgi:hypothetical protein